MRVKVMDMSHALVRKGIPLPSVTFGQRNDGENALAKMRQLQIRKDAGVIAIPISLALLVVSREITNPDRYLCEQPDWRAKQWVYLSRIGSL